MRNRLFGRRQEFGKSASELIGYLIVAMVVMFPVYIFYSGGYWENLPLLDRISGPKRFKQFVMDPVPAEIYQIRGGYSGFPQGRVSTFFRFKGDFNSLPFVNAWERVDSHQCPEVSSYYLREINATAIYRKPIYKRYKYLLVAEAAGEAMLHIP